MMGSEPGSVQVAGLYALMAGSAILSGFGDILLFHWAKAQSGWAFLAGIVLWIFSLVMMGLFFRYSNLPFGLSVVLLVVIHLFIDIIWDVAVLGSRLSLWQWIGVAFAVASIALLQASSKHS